MPNDIKELALAELRTRYGNITQLSGSRSMYSIGNDAARVYFRYSKPHNGRGTFYGLRAQDLQELEGHPSAICFLWDGQQEPLVIPFADYEDVFNSVSPASDGQYKAHVLFDETGTDLHIARAGAFNVEGNFGWSALDILIDNSRLTKVPDLSHSQVQTLLGAIGNFKGYEVWVPASDRSTMDWTIVKRFECRDAAPTGFQSVLHILQEVDVVWLKRGSSELRALFEVEHSTPIYSGLLRFNDVRIEAPAMNPRFTIVANEVRRDRFVRQVERPTFRTSGLEKLCSFLDYSNVYSWYRRVATPDQSLQPQ